MNALHRECLEVEDEDVGKKVLTKIEALFCTGGLEGIY
jgi:hypothetical protein